MPETNPTGSELCRRGFLRGMAGASAAAASQAHSGRAIAATGFEPATYFQGLIARQKGPDNLEYPFSSLETFLTPNDLFFVRAHFDEPVLTTDSWRLRVEGKVKRPLELTYDDVRDMPPRTVTALLECSGNSRVFLRPPEEGIRWELGGVSNAQWTGVPLSLVLERAGLVDSAVEVILEGADHGQLREPEPKSPGVISYARSLPVSKAKQSEVLLAYRMNGQELPRAHGFPVRAVVPGWYGMASVKWLNRIIVTDRPFQGYFQTFTYSVWERQQGLPSLVPVTELQPKAQIARPASMEVLAAGESYRVHGAAWTGDAEVAKVELSLDGSVTWIPVQLLGDQVRYSWRLWEHRWENPTPGRHILIARATDSRGRVQPMTRNKDLRDAMICHALPVEVTVR